ncbi:MAG TPA: cyclic-di-AMP receptor [Anaerolineaceae bacterium]|jgi:uncharacterized protein YaaQ
MTDISPSQEDDLTTLLLAVVQAQDVDGANHALAKLGISTTPLPSIGGFLGRRNATLLIGMKKKKRPAAINALSKTCRQRVEYIAVPLESAPLPLPAPTPVTIGGATIFSLDVEHFEEF